jgi:hypothetical protein
MRATRMFGAGDTRIEKVPDALVVEPTDAPASAKAISGPYKTMEHSDTGRRIGHEAIGVDVVRKDWMTYTVSHD